MWLGAIKRGRDRLQLLSPSPGITSGRFLTAVKPPGDVFLRLRTRFTGLRGTSVRGLGVLLFLSPFFLTGYHVIGATRVPRRL